MNGELYSTLRSQILMLDPLPPLDKIFNMTQQEENHKKIMIARDNQNEAEVGCTARGLNSVAEKGAVRYVDAMA